MFIIFSQLLSCNVLEKIFGSYDGVDTEHIISPFFASSTSAAPTLEPMALYA